MPRPKEYPAIITPEELARLAHISDAEMARDIAETEQEVEDLGHCQTAWTLLGGHALEPGQRQINDLKAAGAPQEIADRRAFIAYLQRVQIARTARIAL